MTVRVTRLLAICVLALLLCGCMPVGNGTMITLCDNRAENSRGIYTCTTLWVRPVTQVEPLQPAYQWSCVRTGSGMQAAGWLQEY